MKLHVFNTDTGKPETFEIATDKSAYLYAAGIALLIGTLIGFAIHTFH